MRKWLVGLLAAGLCAATALADGVATLPVAENYTGTQDWTALTGFSGSGVGTYADGRCKFDSNNDWLMVQFDGDPAELTFDVKGNTASGTSLTSPASFLVEESADAETWSQVANLDETAFSTDYASFGPFTLAAESRYVRWTYANKYGFNLGLNNVAIGSGGPVAFALSLDPSEDFTVVQGKSATITANVRGAQGDVTYSWSVNGTPIDLAGNVYTVDSAELGEYEVAVEVSDGVAEALSASVKYTVVEAPVVTGDVLTRETTGVSGTSYKDWTATGDSGAEYAGNSAGGNDSIQMRTTNPSGIVITKSSGKDVASVTVEWNDATAAEKRSLEIYGSTEAYAGPAALYEASTKGELLGTIARDGATLEIPEGYPYVGILAKGGAVYLTSVAFEFAGASGPSVSLSASATEVEVNEPVTITATAKNFSAEVEWAWEGNDGGSADGAVYTVKTAVAGEFTIKATATAGDEIAEKSVTITVSEPAQKYAVNVAIGILNGGVTADKEEAEEGELVTLTASADAGYKLGTFLLDGEAITGNTFNMPAHDVLVSAEFVEKPVVAGFTKITSLDELTEGEYVITGAKAAGEEYAMMASVSDGKTAYLQRREAAVELEEDVVTDAEDSIIWTLAQGADGWTIYNEAVGYAGYVAGGNSSGAEAEPSAKSSWTITASETAGLFLLENVDKEGRFLLYNSGSPRFACYTNLTSGKHLALYKGSSGPSIAYTGETEKTLPDAAFELVFTLRNYEGDFRWSLVEGEGTLGEGGVYTWTATEPGEYTIKVAAINGELQVAPLKEVTLKVNGPVVVSPITIGEIANGSVVASIDGEAVTVAPSGATVTLAATAASGFKFSSMSVTYGDTVIPFDSATGTFEMPAEEVFVSAEFVEITGETYVRVESADDFEEGAEYLVVSFAKDKFTSALKNEASGSRIGVEEVVIADDNTVTTDSDAIVWKIQAGAADGQYVLFNEAAGVYAAGPKSEGNNAQLLADGTDALAQWTLDFADVPAVAIGSVAYPERQLNRNSTAQYNYFATYKGSGTKPFLFKKAGAPRPKIVYSGETTIALGDSFEIIFGLLNYEGDFEWVLDSREGGTIVPDGRDGLYTWTPTEATDGVTIKVVARSGELDIASKEITLIVTEPGPQPGDPAIVIDGPASGMVGTELSCTVTAINMADPAVYFEGNYGAPEGSTLTTDGIVFEDGVCTFTPDIAGEYWIEFCAYEGDAGICDKWTVTVTDEPGPGGVFQITGVSATGGNLVLTFAGEGTPAVLGTASLASPQEWTPVEGAAVSGNSATVPMGAQNYITLK